MKPLINLFILLSFLSFLQMKSKNGKFSVAENRGLDNTNCIVKYETHIKKSGFPVSIYPSRIEKKSSPYSQITVVTLRIECDNLISSKINEEILMETLRSGFDNDIKINSLNELLNTIDSSGIYMGKEDKSNDFIRVIDNELVHINTNYISIKETDSYQYRISNPMIYYTTINMNLLTGERLEFDKIVKKEKYKALENAVNDSIKINFEEFYNYNNSKIELTDCFNFNNEGITLHYQSYGNRYATVFFRKEIIKEFINVNFWE